MTSNTSRPRERAYPHPVGQLAGRFYTDRRLTVLVLLLVLATGVSSLMVLPRMEDPLMSGRACNISTIYPGADAERVEALVTEKIEDKLIDITEIKRMRSQSRAGSSFIAIELRDDITDAAPIWSAIRGKLEDSISDLPQGASRPEFDELDFGAFAWIGAIVWDRDGPESTGVMRRLALDLRDEFFAVDGTKKVELFGDPLEEILVEIDPDAAASVGLSAAAIAQQLSQTDVKSPAGMLVGSEAETVVELENQFDSLQDILNATLQSGRAGATLKLSDVAAVRRSAPEPAAARAIIDGRPGIVVSVRLRPDYRIDHWAANARQVVEDFQQRLPTGIELDIIMEQQRYVTQRMTNLARNLLLSVSAVSLVTFIFMGWRSSLLVTATLPVASLMVVGGMRFLGIPIHQISITGLIIALGLLIDNAIIAADEIDISLRRGFAPVDAVKDMVSRLFAPLLASTATTALAFAPIALMQGPAGEFVGSIAITVMLAIFSSLFLALTILPASAAHLQAGTFLKMKGGNPTAADNEHPRPASRLGVVSAGNQFLSRMVHHGVSLPRLTSLYTAGLHKLLAHPLAGIALGVTLPVAGFVAATQLREQFFPPADRDQFYVEVELEPQVSMRQTQRLTKQIDSVLLGRKRVQHTTWFLGESAPTFFYNIIARRTNSPNYAQAIVTLDSNQNALALIRELQVELDSSFPSARILVRQLEQGPPFDAPVEIRIFGSDLEQLKDYGEQLRTMATRLPNVLHTKADLCDTRPVASVTVNSAEAGWTGLTEKDVADQLFARLEGIRAGSIIEQVEEIPVRVRMAGTSRDAIENLADSPIFISTAGANRPGASDVAEDSPAVLVGSVPVSSIASVQLKPQRAIIKRFNGRRMNEVQSFITAGILPSSVLADLQHAIEESVFAELPAGYSLEVGGEASERDTAVSRLLANVSILAVAMVAALVLALASFRLAALIGLVASLSVGLGLGALWLFDYPFGFMAIVGTMGLVGIAINDSIVVMAALKANPAAAKGDVSATVETVVEVTRHVLATTFTTIVGFLPLLLSGEGFWPPLAVAIGAGVAGATLIALTLVPCSFRWMAMRSRFA